MQVELMTISTVTIRSIWHNSAAEFLRFENFRHKFANLVVPPTDGTNTTDQIVMKFYGVVGHNPRSIRLSVIDQRSMPLKDKIIFFTNNSVQN